MAIFLTFMEIDDGTNIIYESEDGKYKVPKKLEKNLMYERFGVKDGKIFLLDKFKNKSNDEVIEIIMKEAEEAEEAERKAFEKELLELEKENNNN